MTNLSKQKHKVKPVHYPRGAAGFNKDNGNVAFTDPGKKKKE